MKLKGYVDATQKGYAYGLVDRKGYRWVEYLVHDKDIGGDKAYREAATGSSTLEYTWKHTPRLIKGRENFGRMPGVLFPA